MVRCESKNGHQKNISNKGDWTIYSNMLTILGSTIDVIGGGRGSIRPLNEHNNLHFDDTKANHVSFEMYEANGYMHNLDLLIISH